MRKHLKTTGRWLGIGWFWAGVLLVLPNCGLNSTGTGPPLTNPPNLNAGSAPRSDAIFCDIEKPLGRHCATAMEKTIGISLSDAAVALNEGRTSSIALDYSAASLANCGGEPEAVEFQGTFPEGLPVCVNCGEVITGVESYPDVNAACRARCYDFFGTTSSDGTLIPDNPPSPTNKAFCDAQAKASTNFPLDNCFAGVCGDGGTLIPGFFDPRRKPEPVIWADLIGTAAGGAEGNDLTRTAAFTGAWDAAGVSSQWIGRGNGFVEFAAGETDKAHLLGFSEIPAACPAPCPDADPSLENNAFAIALDAGGAYYVYEHGIKVPGPDVNGSFGVYTAGERFRVSLTDNDDGSATVTYSRLVGTCTPGTVCNEVVFNTHVGTPATYPIRVDVSLYDTGATVTDVRLVRIK